MTSTRIPSPEPAGVPAPAQTKIASPTAEPACGCAPASTKIDATPTTKPTPQKPNTNTKVPRASR